MPQKRRWEPLVPAASLLLFLGLSRLLESESCLLSILWPQAAPWSLGVLSVTAFEIGHREMLAECGGTNRKRLETRTRALQVIPMGTRAVSSKDSVSPGENGSLVIPLQRLCPDTSIGAWTTVTDSSFCWQKLQNNVMQCAVRTVLAEFRMELRAKGSKAESFGKIAA